MAPTNSDRPTIGQSFPFDDPVGQWVTALAMAMNDFVSHDTRIHDSLEADSPDSRYFIRLLCGALREVWQLIDISQIPDGAVNRFALELPTESQAALQALASIFVRSGSKENEEPNPSWAEEHLKGIRNGTFHYPQPGDAQLSEALHETREAGVVIHGGRSTRPFEFADLIALQMSFGDIDQEDNLNQFKEILEKVKEIQSLVLTLVYGALNRQFHRRGVDPLAVMVEDESDDPKSQAEDGSSSPS